MTGFFNHLRTWLGFIRSNFLLSDIHIIKQTMSKIQRNKKDNQETASESFFKFMLQKEQKYQVIAFIALYFILYYVITYLNPYPASISDSGAYVNAALSNRIDTYRPFGYSQFLISIHKWSTSIHFVVAVQYLINAILAPLHIPNQYSVKRLALLLVDRYMGYNRALDTIRPK
jgi:hypothetical protein